MSSPKKNQKGHAKKADFDTEMQKRVEIYNYNKNKIKTSKQAHDLLTKLQAPVKLGAQLHNLNEIQGDLARQYNVRVPKSLNEAMKELSKQTKDLKEQEINQIFYVQNIWVQKLPSRELKVVSQLLEKLDGHKRQLFNNDVVNPKHQETFIANCKQSISNAEGSLSVSALKKFANMLIKLSNTLMHVVSNKQFEFFKPNATKPIADFVTSLQEELNSAAPSK